MSTADNIRIKRAYEAPNASDGRRFLVDRVWPRGRRKEDLRCEAWCKDVAPTTTLRRWFGHEPERWDEFQRLYFEQLEQTPEAWMPLLEAAREGTVTLVYGARDVERNQAVALARFLVMHDTDSLRGESSEHHPPT
ncbi:MAG: DUF488 family protein [Polyangiaceae bacterium]|nr:DUF488 family protein [Polyangiaceae bacterium]